MTQNLTNIGLYPTNFKCRSLNLTIPTGTEESLIVLFQPTTLIAYHCKFLLLCGYNISPSM